MAQIVLHECEELVREYRTLPRELGYKGRQPPPTPPRGSATTVALLLKAEDDLVTLISMQDFYWDGYHIVREQAPHWLFLMHDSFNFDVNTWGDFMKNCPTIGLDTHIYQVPTYARTILASCPMAVHLCGIALASTVGSRVRGTRFTYRFEDFW